MPLFEMVRILHPSFSEGPSHHGQNRSNSPWKSYRTTNRRTVVTLVEWSTASWMSVENSGFPDELLPARGLIVLDSRGDFPPWLAGGLLVFHTFLCCIDVLLLFPIGVE